ncbi:MAG: hypothetical protein ACOYXT_04390 [Bacteroidota bacterium]
MKFNWSERKQIFSPQHFPRWGRTHAQVPFFFEINGNKYIYFTSRPPKLSDNSYVSNVHSAQVELTENAFNVIRLEQKPLLQLGDLGAFDETGTMPCSIVQHPSNGQVWMYYVGWNRKHSVPYDCAVGLAVSTDHGQTFKKYSNGPIMGQNLIDPFLVGCPRVYIFGGKWYMFYLAGVKWVDFNGKKESYYKLRLAISEDGLNWTRNTDFIIPEVYEMESQTCASVFFWKGSYHMFFTFRHTVDFRNPQRGYRIGYARSTNLLQWERNDSVGNFSVSESGWDSEMVCYPNVNVFDEKLVMFYCGNNFGLDGFGYTVNKT